MAVRFTNSAGQPYQNSLTLGAQAQVSLSIWFKVVAATGLNQTVLSLDDILGGSSTLLALQANSTPNTMSMDKNTSGIAIYSFTIATGTWYYAGFSCNGANWTQVNRSHTASSFSSSTGSTGNATTTCKLLTIDEIDGSERMDGNVAAFKLWVGATLTQAELENEAWTYVPQRTANLTAWYPFPGPGTADYSGNGRTLTGGTGATYEDGPPIAWRSRTPSLYVPAAAAPQTSLPPVRTARRLQPLLAR